MIDGKESLTMFFLQVNATDKSGNKTAQVNPEYIRSIEDVPGGSIITFSDGARIGTTETAQSIIKKLENYKL
jgi:hypothetical protein